MHPPSGGTCRVIRPLGADYTGRAGKVPNHCRFALFSRPITGGSCRWGHERWMSQRAWTRMVGLLTVHGALLRCYGEFRDEAAGIVYLGKDRLDWRQTAPWR